MGNKHSTQTSPSTKRDYPKIDSNYSKPVPGSTIVPGTTHGVINTIGEKLTSEDRATNYAMTSSSHRNALYGTHDERTLKITRKLLSAVAYGMESKTVNIPMKPSDTNGLFNPNLFAEDLLKKSPEFLLERGDITDWGGRTFNHITAFEYALWAKDFKMIEMMLCCIPNTSEGDEIRAALLLQYNQVKAPIYACGGLTYTLTYDQPCLDANDIPIQDAAGNWQTTSVTEIHTENHFDVTPLLTAYKDYETHFNTRTWAQRDACWIKIIGTLQHLLPIHLLQRYCSPDTPFYPLPEFTGVFKRATQFYNIHNHVGWASLLSSSLSTDFSLYRGSSPRTRGGRRFLGEFLGVTPAFDLAGVRRVDEVSTNEIETKIKQQLTPTAQSQTQLRT